MAPRSSLSTVPSSSVAHCSHCQRPCAEDTHVEEGRRFCCQGCRAAYDILRADGHRKPSLEASQAPSESLYQDEFAYLDERAIRKRIVDFELPQVARVHFHLPAIHCAACMETLERLPAIHEGILKAEVNFVKKTIDVSFAPQRMTLSRIATALAAMGYRPDIRLGAGASRRARPHSHRRLIQLAVAGFCFGNIMLLSFPEYLGIDDSDTRLRQLFSYFNIALSLPVLSYSARDYFTATWRSLRQRHIGIDLPIVIGMTTLFARSLYDILAMGQAGYLDSLSGLVFFLLIGKWFQSKTYESLAFDRDYRSYFPLAVYREAQGAWKPTVIHALRPADRIRVRNREVVPADSRLLDAHAHIDYSFVTGESAPVSVQRDERIYAGGRLVGKPAVMEVEKKASQSHLTSLWNSDLFNKPSAVPYRTLIDRVASNFTLTVLLIACGTALYWAIADPAKVWLTVTAVLIVACPCALALAAPFTYGSMLRAFGRHGFYLKNAQVVEKMAHIDALVFDKTGTVTRSAADVRRTGTLSSEELLMVKALASSSTHPLSALVAQHIKGVPHGDLTAYEELPGKGIAATIDGVAVKIGSASFVGAPPDQRQTHAAVYVAINGRFRGAFVAAPSVRKGVDKLLRRLGDKVVALLSGDGDGDGSRMQALFPKGVDLRFDQSPHDKLRYVAALRDKGKKNMMIGDGLNDAGALKKSDVGVAITDEAGVFTPACDAMLDGDKLPLLDRFLALSGAALSIFKISLLISFAYNVLGLFFAVGGYLSPLVAAVLMPVSSVSVVAFTVLSVRARAKRALP